MISAGTIGGGELTAADMAQINTAIQTQLAARPATPEISAAPGQVTMPVPSDNNKLPPMTDPQAKDYRTAQVNLMNNAAASLAPKSWYQDPNVLNGITNLGNQVFAWLTQTRLFEMQEHFADKAVERDEHISDNQVVLTDRLATAAERIQPLAIREQRDALQIHEDAETQRYDHHLASIERQASVRDLPNYFMGRPVG